MCCRPLNASRSQRGAALIIAMLVFALSATLLVALQREFSLALQRGTNQLFSEQAWAYLIGAEELAKRALQADNLLDARSATAADHLGELWAQPATPYPLDAGGWMTGQLTDLQGRINLNMLVSDPAVQNPASGDEDVSNGDSGSDAAGGEDDEGERIGSGESLNQSRQQNELIRQTAGDEASRWTPTQKLLIRLLQTLDQGALSLEEAMALTEAISDFIDPDANRRRDGAEADEYRYADFPYLPANRREGGIAQVADLLTGPILEGRPSTELEPLLDIRSDWFLLDASVELLDRQRHLFTVLRREADTTVAVFRSEGEL